MRPTRTAALLVAALSVAGCFKGVEKTPEAGQKGQFGVFYVVSVSRPVGGTVTSTTDDQINCGTAGSGKDACVGVYEWKVAASFNATADAGQVFQSWAGDCSGVGVCTVDTVTYGSDKTVVAVFNPPDQLGHARIPNPAQHGPMFFDYIKKVPNTAQCQKCHGVDYKGLANAPSCETCHAQAGFPDWLNNCTFCHADPPAAPHVQSNLCSSCHAGYGDKTGSGIQATNAATHMNGRADVAGAACTMCHGTPNVNAAPPIDTQGRSGTTLVSVGAHQKHLNTTMAKPVACGECHVVPTDSGHATQTPGNTVAFGALANQGTSTVWNSTQATCASSYCHGGTTAVSGGVRTTPTWTVVTGMYSACTACHGAPPPAPHAQNADCGSCHTGYTVTSTNAGTHVNGTVDVRPLTCSSCHGDALRTGTDPNIAAAPPLGTNGETLATSPAVGAHMAHLNPGTLARAFACTDCHNPPTSTTHATGAVEFSFSVLAGGASVAYDPVAHTCSNTYCHGNFARGNPSNSVALSWTGGSAAAACGSCHGAPPPAPHSQSTACGSCHPGYTATSVNLTSHVNGFVDVVALNCTSCHGTVNVNPAPPLDTSGLLATTLVSVGAHQSHVTTGLMAAPIACTECHGAASASYGTAHADNTVQIQFGSRSNSGTTTVWNGSTCASSYCHGGTFPTAGGTAKTPTWTLVDGTQKSCGSCHGAPPPGPSHPASTACGSCHPGYTSNAVAAASHINGVVDIVLGPTSCNVCHGAPPATPSHRTAGAISTCATCHDQTVDTAGNILTTGKHSNGVTDLSLAMNCAKCHGTAGRAPNPTAFTDSVEGAPPKDLSGNTAPSAPGVGAHLVHVNGLRSKNLLCSECHDISSVFTGLYSHASGTVDMAWGTLASAGGIAPTYVLGSGSSCNATYCHGNFAGGKGAGASPAWTLSGTLGCTSCHDAPPALSAASHHPANTSCGACHGAGYSSGTVVQASHVDGRVTLSRSGCTLCHGDLTVSAVAATSAAAAPGFNATAADTTGATAATSAAVGAHGKHLTATSLRAAPIACGDCHTVPGTGDVTHATGVGSGGARASVAFSGLATAGAVTTATYAGSTTGSGLNGAGTCSNTYCHGNFQGGLNRPMSWTGAATDAACGTCHGAPPAFVRNGTTPHSTSTDCAACHGAGYAISGISGAAAATHLDGTFQAPTGGHAAGWVDTVLANRGGPHAISFSEGGTSACTSCHGAALDGVGGSGQACTACHDGGSHAITTAGGQVVGPIVAFLSGASPNCTACHGTAGAVAPDLSGANTRAEPPLATRRTAARPDAGSHGKHSVPATGASSMAPLASLTCSQCHGTPTSWLHADGAVNFAWGGVASAGGAVPAFTQGTNGCASTYCHGSFRNGNAGNTPIWGSPATATCGTCHGSGTSPLPRTTAAGGTHPVMSSAVGNGETCGTCHASYTASSVSAAIHVDGKIDVLGSTCTLSGGCTINSCTACHGNPPTTTAIAGTGTTHPNRTDCGTCHPGAGSVGAGQAAGAGHMNGQVDLSTMTCTSCHGTSSRVGSDANAVAFSAAPPVDSSGAATGAKTGAHAKHLFTGAAGGPGFSAQVACAECHDAAIPVTPLHANGQPNVAFGPLASTGAATPAYAPGATGTCSNTYCHGNFQNGAGANPIAWTAAAMTCTSCHGTPPGGTHPAGSTLATCGNCHGNYSNAAAAINPATGIIDPAGHVNGTVDLSNMSCTSCHGTPGRIGVAGADLNVAIAPPVVASANGVTGAHLAHVNQGAAAPALSNAMACVNCHVLPTSSAHADGTVGVAYASLAVAQGAVPAPYDSNLHTCSNTYCHGNFPGGNRSLTALSWGMAGKLGCTSCHGAPPAIATHHPANTACANCHSGYTATTVTAATHVDGTVQKPANGCTACHGVLSGQAGAAVANTSATAAPGFNASAVDATGSSATTSRGVGAHFRHLAPTLRTAGLSCTECHGAVPAANDTTHANGVVAVAWGTLASANGSVPATSVGGSTLSCSATWCHGGNAALSGGTATTIAWNANATVNCTSCHGSPPAGNGHPANDNCATCHGTGYAKTGATTGTITVGALDTHINGSVTLLAAAGCASCHGDTARVTVAGGDGNVPSAPPIVASATGVAGVHLAHVNQGATAPAFSSPIACSNCHTVPGSTSHSDGTIGVTYAGLAIAQGALPAPYDGASHTCSNTYCHGNFPGGNQSATAISWSTSGKLGCTSCHGAPPAIATHHPANTACASCHTGYTATTVTAATHVDGTVQKPASGCTACHGVLAGQAGAAVANTSATAAPGFSAAAVDASGSALATSRGVGAHQRHLTPTLRSVGLSCTECHGAIPAANDTTHANGAVAVAWGTLASANGSVPGTSVVGSTLSCSASWCHGGNAALSGGTATTIAWNANATVNCTSCHGNPPAGLGHPANDNCSACHGAGYTKTAATTGTVALATHIDGVITVTTATSCSSCHGTTGRVSVAGADVRQAAAPPIVASATGVAGVHLAHVNQGATAPALSSAMACVNCHTVPTANSHADGTVAVAYAGLSVAQGATPTPYDGAAHTCSNTYCHGNFPGGNQSATAISWATSGKLGCTACHGAPPAIATHHPANTNCVACHAGYTATTVTAATHVDGTVQKPASGCTACHGVLSGQAGAAVANTSATAAPGFSASAVDASGSSATTSRGVGAHLRHLTPTLRSAGLSCTECHGAIPAANDTTHANGAVAVAWGTLASTNGSVPAMTTVGSTLSCSATWCHGGNAALSGATAATIDWNTNATVNCTSCHGNPPAGLGHPANDNCSTCHGAGYTKTAATTGTVALATHIDGVITVTTATSCSSCHGTTGRVSVAGADVRQAAAPPIVASATGVAGVHLAHVNQGATAPALSSAMACVNCHTVPTANSHADGTVGVTYAGLSVAQGATPTPYDGAAHTCSNTYCHGNFPGGNQSATAISWSTSGKLGCTSCHGAPPAIATHHPANTACASCHTGYTATTVTAATHVDGTVQKPANGCTACHGVLSGQAGAAVANTSATAAPGFSAAAVDASGSALTTSRGVGAHLRHLTPTLRTAGLSCTECHGAIPAANDTTHADGAVAVAWGTLASTNGSVPGTSVVGSTLSCSATWCHGGNAALSGATAATIAWNANATVNCTSCHGNPPAGLGHPANDNCATCHGTGYAKTAATTGAITLGALATHIDGVITMTTPTTCTTCHGATGRASGGIAGVVYDANQASAPPADSRGGAAGILVGTHAAHVNPVAGGVYKPVACTECHPNNTANNHGNATRDVTFATATGANLGLVSPTFALGDGTTTQTTCTTYCHGASLNATTTRGSVGLTWSWNGAAASCGSCHQSPPATANHHNAAALTTCANCHSGTVSGTGVVNVAGNLHVNGSIDVSTTTCTTCHGATLVATGIQDPNVGAAPRGTGAPDTYGLVDPLTANGVGVHASHVLGTRSRPVLCNACHTVPTAQIHKTGQATAGTVLLGGLATNGGIATASYAGAGGTCSNTYCHGNLGGGVGATNVTPTWKAAATLACVSCHGMPPSATSTGRTHPNRNDCGSCHSGYSGVAVSAATHVNGTVEYTTQSCTSCHGTSGRGGTDSNLVAFDSAPPVDSSNALTGAKVGAHAKHLFTGAAGGPSFSKQVACSECHDAAIPATPLHANGAPNVAFGTLAKTGTATPAYTPGATGTCSNTYCHGNFTNGAGANPITWTAAAMTCNSCHGTPPGGTHPAGSTITTCGNCHGNYSNTAAATNPLAGIIDPAGHVNGAIDLSNMSCTSCHGTAGRTNGGIAGVTYDANLASSPPLDTANLGASARVGTHVSHVNPTVAGGVYKPVACTECHPNNTSNAHANSLRDVVFPVGGAARLAGYAAGFTLGDGTSQTTCATYCHGASLNATTTLGTGGATWSWNSAVAADCGSCHKAPPTTANHHNAAALTTCATCHPGTVSASGAILVSGNLHVNGAVDTSTFTCSSCHGGSLVATGNQDANVGVAPRGAGAPDTYGLTATTARGVGVHASHVLGTRSRPVLCNACHAIPGTQIHKTGAGTTGTVGLANLSLTGGITTASYSTTALTCSNTYCHGSLGGGVGASNVTPAWTSAATLACTSCHGAPPTAMSSGGTHPARADCGTCHTGYAGTSAATWTVNAAGHVDGAVQVVAQTCTSCHGTTGRASVAGADTNQASAPPADSHGSSSSVLVGMHLAHVNPAAQVAATGTGTQPTGGVYPPIACTECHPNNTSMTHSNGTVNLDFSLATGARLNNFAASFTQGNGTTVATTCSTYCHGAGLGTSYQGTTIVPAWNDAVAACDSCHDFPPLTAAHTGPPLVASDSKVCASCHAGTVNPDGTINVAGGRHINGASDAVKGDTCSGCHDFGMVAATTYHHVMATDPGTAYPVNNGPAIPDSSRNCNICHMKHEFTDKAANLRNTINSATPAAATTDTALCVSCHQQNVQTKDLTRQKTDGTAQTALIDSAAFTGSAHDYLVDGAFGVNVMQVNCVKCHNSDSTPAIQTGTYKFALHSSADRRLRAPLGRATLTDDDSANFCYRCHSATTDAALTGTRKTATANDWYGKVTTMPAGSTGIFAQMQKGTAGTAGVPTTSATTLYFKRNADEASPVNLPGHYGNPATEFGTGSTGTFVTRFMTPRAATAATYETLDTTAVTVPNVNPTRHRRVAFVSPPVAVATPASATAGAWSIRIYDRVSATNALPWVRYAIYKYDGTCTVNVASPTCPLIVPRGYGPAAMGITNAPGSLQTISIPSGNSVALNVGDRIVVDLEIETRTTTQRAAITMSYFFGGTNAASSLVIPSAVTFDYVASVAVPASGRHDVGNASYVGKHKPNPAEEHLQYIAANKHVDCADCHDPHKSKRGNQDDTGTYSGATGSAVTTLTDATKNWLPNAFVGYVVDIYTADSTTAAPARGQITANSSTTLTFGLATGNVTPAAGSNRYRVSMKNGGGAVSAADTNTVTSATNYQWMTNAFAGWYLHIVDGPGTGQSALILSNTSTQVTHNKTWAIAPAVLPTTASRYVISKLPNVMLGAAGVQVSAWGAGTPTAWGEAKTFSPAAGSTTELPEATTQWQVCFKCHSSANSSLATWGSSFTDLAQDFNPRNKSFHPVLAPAASVSGAGYGNTLLTAADLTNGWKPGDMMTCSDCHGNNDQGTGASHGPHASAVKYILKGPNTRWPYMANGTTRWSYSNRTTSQGTADGLFCLNCHSSSLRQMPHYNKTNHEGIACSGCHLRLPHGGKVARLIRTTNTPAVYVDTAETTSRMGHYNHGAALNEASCGAGCTGTHQTAADTTNSW